MGETTVLQLPFAGGMDQKAAQEYLDPSSHVSLVVNGDFDKQGAINKRLGMGLLPTGTLPPYSLTTPITTGKRLASWTRARVVQITQDTLYEYAQATNSFTPISPVPACFVTRRPFFSLVAQPYTQVGTNVFLSTTIVSCDVPHNGRTLRVVLYNDTNSFLYSAVIDRDSGEVIMPPTGPLFGITSGVPLAALYLPNAPAGQQVALFMTVSTGGATVNVFAATLNLANLQFTGTTLQTFGITDEIDIAPFIGDPAGGFFILYASAPAGTVTLTHYSPSLNVLSARTVETLTGGNAVTGGATATCHATYGGTIWCVYGVTAPTGATPKALKVAAFYGTTSFPPVSGYPYAFYSVSSATGLQSTGVVATSSTTAVSTCTTTANTSGGMQTNVLYAATFTTASTTIALYSLPYGMFPVARPFVQNGRTLQPCIWSTAVLAAGLSANYAQPTLQTSIYVLWIDSPVVTGAPVRGLPVATIAPRQVVPTGGSFKTNASIFPIPFGSGTSDTSRVAIPVSTLGDDTVYAITADGASTTTLGNAWWFADISSDATLGYQSGEIADGLHISAGIPFVDEGIYVQENNFVHYPEFGTITTAGTSGTLSGVYIYTACYSYVDSAGNIARSAPWQFPSVNLSGGALATLQIPMLSTTWREYSSPGKTNIEIYRTTSNGSTFYLIGTVSAQYLAAGSGTYATFGPDKLKDSEINTNTILYTTGGVLDAVNPPASAMQVVHKNRLWIVDETLRGIWFTRTSTPGESLCFNEDLYLPCSEYGDITALASLDDKLVIFKANSIFLVYGDGPADTGTGSDLTVPQRLPTDVGALDWRSVVLMPNGLMFRSAQGIYLLDRGQNVTYAGKNVEDSLAQYPTVVGATLVSSAQHVRFLCTNGTTTAALVYDYQSDAWGTYVYATTAAPPVSCAISGDSRFLLGTTDGNIWQEHLTTDATAYKDDTTSSLATFVPTTIKTPWVKLNGLQAYLRARRAMVLGAASDSHGLTMGFAVNYNPAVVQTYSWTSPFLAYGSQASQHFAGAYNKSMAVQITLSDFAGTTTTNGAGCRFLGLAIELDNIGQMYSKNAVASRA